MNKTFNIKRFWKYFIYDIRNAGTHYWLSLLILGFLPVFSFVIFLLFNRLINGSWEYSGTVALQASCLIASAACILLGFGKKAYGNITDKRSGSDWLMLPASSFEKWLSMIVITCVILPVVWGVLYFGSDALLYAVIPDYSLGLFKEIARLKSLILAETDGVLSLNITGLLYLSWVLSILPFTLGAIFFKRSKIAKTILALFVIGIAFSFAQIGAFGMNGLTSQEWQVMASSGTAEEFIRHFNDYIGIASAIELIALMVGLYVRIKTLKH